MLGRPYNALLFFILLHLIYFAASAIQSQGVPEEELGMNLATTKHHHKHSGLSEADCPSACQFRCSKTQYKKPCLFFCQKCCVQCKCVPPGTYAHKEACPCYNNWKTKRGGPKCP